VTRATDVMQPLVRLKQGRVLPIMGVAARIPIAVSMATLRFVGVRMALRTLEMVIVLTPMVHASRTLVKTEQSVRPQTSVKVATLPTNLQCRPWLLAGTPLVTIAIHPVFVWAQ